jgi:simple sugar transport system permease protein
MLAGMLVFGAFCAALGVNPLLVYASIYKAGFGSWYSWQNTLVRASPLLLCALCTASPRARESSSSATKARWWSAG